MGKWDTSSIDLEVKPVSKPFNVRYHPVPNINKDNLHKEFQHLFEIGVLTPVQKLKYGITVFIIPKKKFTVKFITYYQKLTQKVLIRHIPWL